MLLQLKEIFLTDGASTGTEYDIDMKDIEIDGVYPFVSPVKINAQVQNHAGLVTLKIDARFTFSHPCDRCLDDVTKEYSYSFEHILVVSVDGEGDDEFVEVPDYELDLDELARADILLELPAKYLCKDDCRGICPMCGKNLNLGDCDCNKKHIDPRLEILKQLMN